MSAATASTSSTSTSGEQQPLPSTGSAVVGLQPVSLAPADSVPDATAALTVEPPKKQAKTASQQRGAKNKQDIDFSTGSTLLSWVTIIFLEVRLAFVLRSCELFCSTMKSAVPRHIGLDRFRTLLARVVVRNLVAKVDIWTKNKRQVSVSDRFDYLPLPNMFWYLINAFKPIHGIPGERPDLYPDYHSLVINAAAWHRRLDLPSLEEDPAEVGDYLTCVDYITKRLGKDIFTQDVTSDSLLDSGYLDVPDEEDPDEEEEEPVELMFREGGVVQGTFPKYEATRCVSRRRLSRREEIITCILHQRGYTPVSPMVKVYVPNLLQREEGALGTLMAYCVADRKVERRHIYNELINPEVLPRRT